MLRIPLLIALLLTSASCSGAARHEVDPEALSNTDDRVERGTFPWQGEEMTFLVKHIALNLDLLEATLVAGFEEEAADGTPFIGLYGKASSIALARVFARVDDAGFAAIDPKTWTPLYSTKDLNENDKSRKYFVWYWPEELYATIEKHGDGKVHHSKKPLTVDSLDLLSWLYHLRTTSLEPGAQQTWTVFDGWTISQMTIVIQGSEEVWTPLGIFEAVRMDLYRQKFASAWPQGAFASVYTNPILVASGERYFVGRAWIADDDNRTPIRLTVETKLGDLDLLLQSYSPAP